MEKKCWNCGEILDVRARFCNNCGKSTAGELQKSEFLNPEFSKRKQVELQCVGTETHAPTDLSGVGTDITGAISDDIDKYLNPDVVLQPMVMRKVDKQKRSQEEITEEFNVKGEKFAFTNTSQNAVSYAAESETQAEEGTYQYFKQQYANIKTVDEKKKKDKFSGISIFFGIIAVLLLVVPAAPIVISVFALLISTKSEVKSVAHKIALIINIAALLAGIIVLLSYITAGGV